MMALPDEIYPLSRFNHRDPVARRDARLTLGMGYTRQFVLSSYDLMDRMSEYVPEAREPVFEPNLAIFRVSKQISQEALHVA